MLRKAYALFLLALLIWPALPAQAQSPMPEPPLGLPMDLSVEFARLPAGHQESGLLAAVTILPEPGWYTYANDPGSLGQPTVLSAHLDGLSRPLPVRYPPGVRKPDPFMPQEMVNMYPGRATLFVLLPEETVTPAELRLHLSLLLCSDKSCMPVAMERTAILSSSTGLSLADAQPWWSEFQAAKAGRQPVEIRPDQAAEQVETLPDSSAPGSQWSFEPRFYQGELEVTGIWKAVLLALLAGFVLNFMPCVLPVVSLKISGILAGHANETRDGRRKAFREHNFFFAAGIIVYFLALSLVLSVLGLAWGELFQNPALIMILMAVVFALSLSLFDVYTLPLINLRSVKSDAHNPRASAFMTGMLATMLATPCSGPFLGGVLAWALLQPSVVVAVVFMAIGLGMALPYLLMSARPGLVRFFPKPGAWTVHLERIVGFFLLATCIYLINILPQEYLLSALVLLWVTGISFWAWGAWTNLNQSALKRWAIRGAALTLVAVATVWAVQQPERSVHWQEFSSDEFRNLLGKKRILVDFTADWCVSCKFLEQTTLTSGNLAEWQRRYSLIYVRVDLTEQNPDGMALLRSLGSQSIPTVAVFPQGAKAHEPLVLRDLFGSGTMDKALKRMF